MSVREILEKLAELAAGSPAGPGFDLRLVVDVTNAWSIPCTAQPLELAWHNGLRGRAWVRLQTLRERGERVHAIYRLWT